MWLQDPYALEEFLRRHAEQLARSRRPAGRDGSRLPERAVLALRILVDAALAARVRDAVTTARPAAAASRPRPTRA